MARADLGFGGISARDTSYAVAASSALRAPENAINSLLVEISSYELVDSQPPPSESATTSDCVVLSTAPPGVPAVRRGDGVAQVTVP